MDSRPPLVGVLLFGLVFGAMARSAAAGSDEKITVEPTTVTLCPGGEATFTATTAAGSVEVQWTTSAQLGDLSPKTPSKTVTFVAPSADTKLPGLFGTYSGVLTLTAHVPGTSTTGAATIVLAGPCSPGPFGGEMTRVTLGFEQVGAAGTDSSQKYSFDFFISRPVPLPGRSAKSHPEGEVEKFFGPRLHWWGDVRVGSYPAQVNSDAASFAPELASSLGKLPVNRLAQSAEFLTGPEVRIAGFPEAREAATEATRQRFALTAFAGFGAIGPLNPSDNVTVFEVPTDPASPQYQALHQAYPEVTGQYVAFVPKARDRFIRQWGAGLRLYSFYAEDTADARPLTSAPATVEFSLGQNELVAPASRLVWRASAAYPFALGSRTDPHTIVVYLFGEVVMGLSRAGVTNHLFLAPAVGDNNIPISLNNPGVSVVSVDPNARDTYRIGVSIDLLRVWDKLKQPSAGTGSTGSNAKK